jgi:hypothetical protein
VLVEFGLISARFPGRSSNVASRRSTLGRGRGQANNPASAERVRSTLRSETFTDARDHWRFSDHAPLGWNPRREMTKELHRLMTITDLSEMLGVPVDTVRVAAPW